MLEQKQLPQILKSEGAVFCLFVILAAIVGWPILSNLNHVLIGYDNDVFINPWANWWTQKALLDPELTLWRTDFMFAPGSANLVYHSFSHLNTAVALLLQPLIGVTPAFNLSILLNYPVIGFSMYQLARYLTRSQTAGILAGIAFAFSSHAMYQSAHPVLLSIWCLPWATLFLLRAIDEENLWLAFAAGLFVFLGTFTSTLLFFLMIIWFGFLTIYLFVSSEWQTPQIKTLIVFAIAAALLNLPQLWPLIADALGNQNSSFVISAANERSIVPDILSPIVPHWWQWLWRGLYFGIIGICLMFYAAYSKGKIRLWVVTLILFYLISIGPQPMIFGRDLDIILPWSYLFTPILRNMYRFNILISMGVSMLIGFGWIGFMERTQLHRQKSLMAIIFAVLLFADYGWPQIPFQSPQVSSFYTETLAEFDENTLLTLMPSSRQIDKTYMYYQTLHGHKMTNGVVSRPEADTFAFIAENEMLANRQDGLAVDPPTDIDAALDGLKNAGVNLLIFNKAFMEDDEIEAWKAGMPLKPFFEDDLIFVYEL